MCVVLYEDNLENTLKVALIFFFKSLLYKPIVTRICLLMFDGVILTLIIQFIYFE